MPWPEQREGPVRSSQGVAMSPANHTPLRVSSSPDPSISSQAWAHPTSAPLSPLHTYRQKQLSQNHSLLRDGSGIGLGKHWRAIPRLAEESGVGSHPASSRAPQGGAWPPGPGWGAGRQAGVELGSRGLVRAAWPGCSFPQTATRGQPAPSAEEFSVAQVMAS